MKHTQEIEIISSLQYIKLKSAIDLGYFTVPVLYLAHFAEFDVAKRSYCVQCKRA